MILHLTPSAFPGTPFGESPGFLSGQDPRAFEAARFHQGGPQVVVQPGYGLPPPDGRASAPSGCRFKGADDALPPSMAMVLPAAGTGAREQTDMLRFLSALHQEGRTELALVGPDSALGHDAISQLIASGEPQRFRSGGTEGAAWVEHHDGQPCLCFDLQSTQGLSATHMVRLHQIPMDASAPQLMDHMADLRGGALKRQQEAAQDLTAPQDGPRPGGVAVACADGGRHAGSVLGLFNAYQRHHATMEVVRGRSPASLAVAQQLVDRATDRSTYDRAFHALCHQGREWSGAGFGTGAREAVTACFDMLYAHAMQELAPWMVAQPPIPMAAPQGPPPAPAAPQVREPMPPTAGQAPAPVPPAENASKAETAEPVQYALPAAKAQRAGNVPSTEKSAPAEKARPAEKALPAEKPRPAETARPEENAPPAGKAQPSHVMQGPAAPAPKRTPMRPAPLPPTVSLTPPPKPPRAIPPAALADVGFDPLDVPSVPTLADLHSEPPRHELKVPNPARPNAAARAFEAGFDKLAEQLQTDPEVDLFAPSMVPSVSKAQEAQINALADQLAQWPLETESVVPIPSRVPILSKADEAQYYDLVEELLGVDDTAASLRAASSNGEVPIGFEKVDDRDLSDGYLRPVTAGVQPATGTVESPDGLLPAHVKVAADHVDAQGGEDLDIYEEIGPLPAKAAPPPPPYLAEPPPYTAPALPPRLVKTAPSIQNLDAGRKPEKAAALVSAVDEEVSVPRDIAARWKANPSGDAMMAAVVSEMVATLQARPSVGQRVLGFFGKPPAESARTDAFHELVLERLTGSVNQMRSDFQASAPGLTKAEVRREREDFVESQLVEKLQASLTSLPRAARDRVLERLGNENDQILTAIRRSRDLNLVFLRQNPKARNMHMAGLREAVFTQSRLLNAFKRLTKEAADAT